MVGEPGGGSDGRGRGAVEQEAAGVVDAAAGDVPVRRQSEAAAEGAD